jgi:hypothetical protein
MLRWYRWTVVIVGRESGSVSPPLDFVRFRHRRQAEEWCAILNEAGSDLTCFTPRRIPLAGHDDGAHGSFNRS